MFNLNFVLFQANPPSNSFSFSEQMKCIRNRFNQSVEYISSSNTGEQVSCREHITLDRTLTAKDCIQFPSINLSKQEFTVTTICAPFSPFRRSPHRPHIQLNNWSHNRQTPNHISNIVQVIIPQTNTTTRFDTLFCTVHFDCQIRENHHSWWKDRSSVCTKLTCTCLGCSMFSNDKL